MQDSATATDEDQPIRILYINSYEPSLSWVRKLSDTITETFPRRKKGEKTTGQPDYRLTREHLNGKFYWGPAYLDAIVEEMRSRYSPSRQDRPQLILASDDLAYRFLTRVRRNGVVSVRDELFGPDTPVIFCGVNEWDVSMEDNPVGQGYWGAFEQPGVEKTAEFIKLAFPDGHLVLVSDSIEITGPAWLSQMRRGVRTTFSSYSELSGNIPLEQLEGQISDLDANSVILLGVYYRDLFVSTDTFVETTDRICKAARSHSPPLPVFGLLDLQAGDPETNKLGIYGGWLISAQSQADKLVELAKEVLAQPREKRIAFVNEKKPIPWPQGDHDGLQEPKPTFFGGNIFPSHRSHLIEAARHLRLDLTKIGLVPPKSLFAKMWEPWWGKIVVILLGKTILVLLLGFRFPKTALTLLRSRDGLSPEKAPAWVAATIPMVTESMWALLFVPDFPTRKWLLRRALRQAAERKPLDGMARKFQAQHNLLEKPRVNMPVLPRGNEASLPLTRSRDQLINAVSREEQYFVCISGRGGAGKSSMALDIGLAAMMENNRLGRTLPVVLAAVPDHWLQAGEFLTNLSVFMKDRINGIVGPGEIDEEMALAGLESGQVCLIIDGLSEMPTTFEEQFGSAYFTSGLPRRLVISSRSLDQQSLRGLGASEWEIPPLQGESLLKFIRDFLGNECAAAGINSVKELKIQATPAQQFLSPYVTRDTEPWNTFIDRVSAKINGKHFSDPWTSRSTCLFVEMRLSALLRKSDDESLAALCRVFISRLIEKLPAGGRPLIDPIIKDLTALAWHVLSGNDFCAAQFSIGQVTPLLGKDSLPILTDALGLIEVSDLGRMGCFTCDPIAEYLAAAYMMQLEPSDFELSAKKFTAALSKIRLNAGEQTYKMRGFVMGIADCIEHGQIRSGNVIELPDAVREKLDIPIT